MPNITPANANFSTVDGTETQVDSSFSGPSPSTESSGGPNQAGIIDFVGGLIGSEVISEMLFPGEAAHIPQEPGNPMEGRSGNSGNGAGGAGGGNGPAGPNGNPDGGAPDANTP
jgi:hypothetical protein